MSSRTTSACERLSASRFSMPCLPVLTLVACFCFAGGLLAQTTKAPGSPPSVVPRLDLSIGYDYIRANAPPGGCQCFSTQGGYLSAGGHITNWISLEGQFTGGRATIISTLGQNLNLLTYTVGPQFSVPGRRFVPFAEALFGGAHATNSYFPSGNGASTGATSFAYDLGGGLDYNLNRHFAIRAVEVQYLHTAFPNGTDNTQRHLSIAAGVVIRFGNRNQRPKEKPMPPMATPAFIPPPPTPVLAQTPASAPLPTPVAAQTPAAVPAPETTALVLTCSTPIATLDQGSTLEVDATTTGQPGDATVTYTWVAGVGRLVGTGRHVLVDSVGVGPGSYYVLGHASIETPKHLEADCSVPYRIQTTVETMRAPVPLPTGAIDLPKDMEFHENVPDVLFNYSSAKIRPDTALALHRAATYLAAHREVRVLLGGYADSRGSFDFNLKLGERRAVAVRDFLIASGVAPVRLQIVTYGKYVQTCTTRTPECLQSNRRVAFARHP